MKPLLTQNLKVKFLGTTPVFIEKGEVLLNPQEIVSLSALVTFKGKSIKRLFQDIKKKGEDKDKKIKNILQKSSLRGHASMATTPTVCLTYEGSKFLDSALTGMVFSSSLMASGRRTDTTEQDIVFPEAINVNSQARKIYYDASKKIIDTVNYLLAQGVLKDEASKLLQYGIYGTGIIQLSVESIIAFKREYEKEKEWMPEEVGFLIKAIEKKLKEFGLDWLYATRFSAARNAYPYPNIFKNPAKQNIARELAEEHNIYQDSPKVISIETCSEKSLKERFDAMKKELGMFFNSLEEIEKKWRKSMELYSDIVRDYNPCLRFQVLSVTPWRIWGEKKRHRTVPQIPESIYSAIQRAISKFNNLRNQIGAKEISENTAKEIEEVFSIPPTVKKNQEYLKRYLETAMTAFDCYSKLLLLGIKEKDAIFLIPRAVKIATLQEYDLHNLLMGYYPLRLCSTAEEELRRNTIKEAAQIKEMLDKKGLSWLKSYIGPKCEALGFCPEEKTCMRIKGKVKDYSEDFHAKMKENIRIDFENNLKNLGK